MAARLGELLIRKGLLDADDLEQALELQKERGDKIGRILIDLGFVNPRDVLTTLSEQLQIPLLTADDFPPILPEVDRITPRYMRQFVFLPIRVDDSTLTVAMSDPLDFETVATLRQFSGLNVKGVLAAEREILDSIDKYFGEQEQEGDSVFGAVDDADAVKHRLDDAFAFIDPEQAALSHQCGFASTAEGNELTEDDQWRKVEQTVAIAGDVWS